MNSFYLADGSMRNLFNVGRVFHSFSVSQSTLVTDANSYSKHVSLQAFCIQVISSPTIRNDSINTEFLRGDMLLY